jgi:hypothetical protein
MIEGTSLVSTPHLATMALPHISIEITTTSRLILICVRHMRVPKRIFGGVIRRLINPGYTSLALLVKVAEQMKGAITSISQ